MERERTTGLDASPQPENTYERAYAYMQNLRQQALQGKVLLRAEEIEWSDTRQGRIKYYLSRESYRGTALKDWSVFVHDIRVHSGKHTHQGGLAIYVLEGEGYTVVNGQRYDWEGGDLLLLPIQPNGCEHQHFNKHPGRPARWLALIYKPFFDEVASAIEQRENAPDYGTTP